MKTNLFLICLGLLFSLSCTRAPQETSLITLSLPASGPMSSKVGEFVHTPSTVMSQSVGAYGGGDGPDWNSVLNPSVIGEVNCYLIAVSGPEADMRRNTCTTTSGQSVFVGRFAGAIPAGGQIAIEVPSGPQRQIMIWGMKANVGACKDFRIGDPDTANLSEPHFIGSATQDLSPGDVAVNITTSLSPNTLKLDDCSGPDFDFGEGGPGLYFGEALASVAVPGSTSPNVDVSFGDFSNSIMLFPNTKTRGGHAKLEKMVPLPNGVGVDVTTPLGSIEVGDEVMVIIMGSKGANLGPTGTDYTACGYRGWQGQYQFARVVSGPSTYSAGYTVNYDFVLSSGTFLSGLWKNANNNANEFEFDGTVNDDVDTLNTRLGQLATSTSFCNIQIVKVQHLYNLNIQSGAELYAPPFSWTSGGGVVAIRVNGTLTMNDNSSINVNGNTVSGGYSSSASKKGDGIFGVESCATSNNANGGGCGNGTSVAGAGGGHGALSTPAIGSPSAGNSQGGAMGGSSVGEDCGGSCNGNLNYKIFMGGAGGASAGAGGKGGGIVYVMARNINITCSSCTTKPDISAKGQDSTSTAGPGAGGSVVLGYLNGTNIGELRSYASGGTYLDTTVDPSPGAGGRFMVKKCTSSPAFPIANALVNPGANPGSASPSQPGTALIQDYPCN